MCVRPPNTKIQLRLPSCKNAEREQEQNVLARQSFEWNKADRSQQARWVVDSRLTVM